MAAFYRTVTILFAVTILGCSGKAAEIESDPQKNELPNIIVILADDMGYGDIGAYNDESLIPTPNLDRMAAEGVRFTDAHTPSSVCTPTRYSVLTGRYAWRTSLKSGVLWGYSPLLIETDRETIPSMLKKQGYHTAGIGKWHLGFGYSEANYYGRVNVKGDNSELIFGGLKPGPNEVGFDYFFGIPASLDMKPYLYVENGKAYTPLTGKLVQASGMRRAGGGGFWRTGQVAEGFVHQDVLPTITHKAVDYIKERGASKGEEPFFLYFALTAPHTPWLPSEEFVGKSKAGYYGDFSVQVDDVVGQINAVLESTGQAENTIVVYTSDNGAHWLDSDIEKYGHLANGPFRGQKADIYEGGHRVPLIITWPEKVPSNSVSEQVTTLADLMATFAEISGATLKEGAAPDSFNILPAMLGQTKEPIPRAPMIHHAMDGMFAIREGDWKLIEGLGSGGFTAPKREQAEAGTTNVQLYNLKDDPKETDNIAKQHPEIVERLLSELNNIRNLGSSRKVLGS